MSSKILVQEKSKQQRSTRTHEIWLTFVPCVCARANVWYCGSVASTGNVGGGLLGMEQLAPVQFGARLSTALRPPATGFRC